MSIKQSKSTNKYWNNINKKSKPISKNGLYDLYMHCQRPTNKPDIIEFKVKA